MRRHPLPVVVALGLALPGLVGLAGCGGPQRPAAMNGAVSSPSVSASATPGSGAADPAVAVSSAPTPSLSPSSDRAVALRSAVGRTAGMSFRFTLGSGVRHFDGRYDASTGAVSMSRVVDGRRMAVEVFGDEMLLSGLAPDGSVLRVDVTRLPVGNELLLLAAPLLTFRLVTGAERVEASGAEGYGGRIDLEKVDVVGSATMGRIVTYLAKQAKGRADDVAFTASVDTAGRIAGFRATFPRADLGEDLRYEFSIIEVGSGVTVTRPAGTVVEAPASMYQP